MKNIQLAVILAAGSGRRLKNIIKDIPKGLISFGEVSIIEESITKLLSIGIRRIVIVTGFEAQQYQLLSDKYPEVELLYNEKYAESGSMYSLFCAKDIVKEDFLLLESDLIYEKRALSELRDNEYQNCLLLSQETKAGDEVYVEGTEGKVKCLSKQMSESSSIVGELVGISKISFSLYKEMLAKSDTMFQSDLMFEYDTGCINSLCDIVDLHYVKMEDLLWAEIDDADHFERAKKLYPLINN